MSILLLTPTYLPDLPRVRLLLESLHAHSCNLKHLLVVQTEDIASFLEFRRPNVEVITTADVLPGKIEASRRRISTYSNRYRILRRSLQKRFAWFPDAVHDGWHTQQLVKLAVAASSSADAVVTLDSDNIICGAIEEKQFINNGKVALHCIRSDLHPHFQDHWNHAASQILGISPGIPAMNYVSHPFVFSPNLVRKMIQHLEQRHASSWQDALATLAPGHLSEFTLYGSYVHALIDNSQYFNFEANSRTRWIYSSNHHDHAREIIQQSFASRDIDFLVIQASRRWPIAPYLPIIQESLKAAHG